jgi:hypothetical protein
VIDVAMTCLSKDKTILYWHLSIKPVDTDREEGGIVVDIMACRNTSLPLTSHDISLEWSQSGAVLDALLNGSCVLPQGPFAILPYENHLFIKAWLFPPFSVN